MASLTYYKVMVIHYITTYDALVIYLRYIFIYRLLVWCNSWFVLRFPCLEQNSNKHKNEGDWNIFHHPLMISPLSHFVGLYLLWYRFKLSGAITLKGFCKRSRSSVQSVPRITVCSSSKQYLHCVQCFQNFSCHILVMQEIKYKDS